jgi:hypothetical protein
MSSRLPHRQAPSNRREATMQSTIHRSRLSRGLALLTAACDIHFG